MLFDPVSHDSHLFVMVRPGGHTVRSVTGGAPAADASGRWQPGSDRTVAGHTRRCAHVAACEQLVVATGDEGVELSEMTAPTGFRNAADVDGTGWIVCGEHPAMCVRQGSRVRIPSMAGLAAYLGRRVGRRVPVAEVRLDRTTARHGAAEVTRDALALLSAGHRHPSPSRQHRCQCRNLQSLHETR